jgi:uncharacterized membrane-anchored protein YitT (DUF2179 family)
MKKLFWVLVAALFAAILFTSCHQGSKISKGGYKGCYTGKHRL